MPGPIDIPWPLSSAPGATPQESSGRLIGCYAEPVQPESGPAKVTYRRSPGLGSFATSGHAGFRGAHYFNGLVYVAFNNKLSTIDSAGVVTDVTGTLGGTKPVTFAHNNASPTPQIACVTENGAFVVTNTSITAWPDGDLPQPTSVAYQDGYFFFTIGDKRVFATDINATSVNALTFNTLQSRAANTLYRGIPLNGMMYFFTDVSCEVYQNASASVTPPAFPYTRLTVLDRGLIGVAAIAGHEEGFGQLLWVANDFGVYQMKSLQMNKVSPPDLDRLIKAVSDPTTLRASVYIHAGHSFWVISSETWTWEYNLNTQKWNERWNIASGLVAPRWRADGGVNAFGKWLMGSRVTGNVVAVDDTLFSEEGGPMLFRMESGPAQNFPNRIRVGRADFDFVTGVGRPSGSGNEQEPETRISWSDDGGVNWSVPLTRKLGRLNQAYVRVSLTNCGQAGPQGRRWRVEVSDAVYVGFLGATMSASARAN